MGSVPILAEPIFRPGISKKEAQKVAREAVGRLESPPVFKGRPTLSEQELHKIANLISIFHSSRTRNYSRVLAKIHEHLKAEGFLTSKSAIDKVYRKFRHDKGLPMKTYNSSTRQLIASSS